MRIPVIVILTLLCIFGRFILRWRRVARTGFGLGTSNIPALVRHPSGKALVWVFGQIGFVGAAITIFLISAWYWSLLAIFLAGGLERLLLMIFCRGDLKAALEFRKQNKDLFDELHRIEGRDPLEDALN